MSEDNSVNPSVPLRAMPAVPFNFRNELKDLDTMREYDRYVTEWRRRLRQLQAVAAGHLMSPADQWYTER